MARLVDVVVDLNLNLDATTSMTQRSASAGRASSRLCAVFVNVHGGVDVQVHVKVDVIRAARTC